MSPRGTAVRPAREGKPLDLKGKNGLRRIKLLDGVPDEDLERLAESCTWREFEEEEPIIDQEQSSSDVLMIVDGSVRIMSEDPATGREVALANIEAGNYFGELAAIDGKGRSATAYALEPALIAMMDSTTFLRVMHDHPDAALEVLFRFAQIIRRLDTRVTELSTKSIDQRICAELLRLAEIDSRNSWRLGHGEVWYVPSMPNHKELASWVGTSKEEVAKVIGQLARDKLVERKSMSLYIRDMGRLRLIAGESGA